jgi:putative membrane protein
MLLKSNIPFHYIIGKIKPGLLLVTLYSIAIAALYNMFHVTRITIPLSVPMILGTVISLLLGFRSNQAYDRWWEARIIWGAIVNDSRSLARQMTTFLRPEYPNDEIQQFRDRFVKRQIAWCFCLGRFLRGEKPLSGLRKYMTEEEIEFVSRFRNPANAMLQLHGRDITHAMEMGWINQYQQVALDQTLTRLCDSMGKCERLKNTVFPATYSLYIHFAMNLFILLLPFGLIEFFGFMEIPIVIAVAASFMLIEKMAIHLQDPFENKPTDTPMTAIAKGIERDLKQMISDNNNLLEETETVETLAKNTYYVL